MICGGLRWLARSLRRRLCDGRLRGWGSRRPTRFGQRVKARKTASPSRAEGYRAGDLERLYGSLGIEDFFVTYGFVTRAVQALMHPRPDLRVPAEGISLVRGGA